MPSTYAHYRMGQEVRKSVKESVKSVIEAYPELYLIGLHGPDILFYYKPLKANAVNQIGYDMHKRTGASFFENAAKTIRKAAENSKDVRAYLSYAYGVICHFALDVTCHGYIDDKIEASKVTHAEIEVEFDRELMVKDGFDPIRHKLTGHLVPSLENAEVIKDFYEGVSTEHVKRAIVGMVHNNNILLAPSRLKRCFVYALLKISGNFKEMHGLMVNFEKNPLCDDSTERLIGLYDSAKKLAVSLINEYDAYLDGTGKLDDIYRYTFGSTLPEKGDV